MVVVGPNPGQQFEGLVVVGAGDSKTTKPFSKKICALTSYSRKQSCVIHIWSVVLLAIQKMKTDKVYLKIII